MKDESNAGGIGYISPKEEFEGDKIKCDNCGRVDCCCYEEAMERESNPPELLRGE